MQANQGRPLWAEATGNVLRAGWPVLLPMAVTVLGLALGSDSALARTGHVLAVVAGAALLPNPRFVALCVTTLICTTATSGVGALDLSELVLEGVVTLPLVAAGRAVWAARGATRQRRIGAQSRFAVTLTRGR